MARAPGLWPSMPCGAVALRVRLGCGPVADRAGSSVHATVTALSPIVHFYAIVAIATLHGRSVVYVIRPRGGRRTRNRQ